MQEYDVIVIGGGSAGTMAAKTASAAGAKTVMFNDGELGGLCILRGCMPTKTMLHAAHLHHHASHHSTAGIERISPRIDFAAIMSNKDVKVKRFKDAKLAGISKGGYEVIDARARFSGKDTVIADGESYRFAKGAVVATGSVVSLPPIPGLAEATFMTSDDVMELRSRPKSMIILGSGAIGLEFAQFYARMGTRVQLVSRRRVFTDAGPPIAEEMAAALRDEPNLTAYHPMDTLAIRDGETGTEVEIEDAKGRQTLRADMLLVATGRAADVEGLDLNAASIEIEKGQVVIDASMRSSNPQVFFAGDASGMRLLLHVANWEGRVAGLGAAQVPGEHRVEARLHVSVVFTDPPLALLGMTVAQAKAEGIDTLSAKARFPETGRAITMDVKHGVCNLVTNTSGEVLGAQILGPRADDLIHILSGIMFYHGTVADMLEMPWYHPTLSEVLLSLAREIQGRLAEH